jgi:ubiquinone/menaquinone biosynthesis C-methylase UbiE
VENSQQVVTKQYKTPLNLEARICLHERFSTNPYGWQRWVFDQFDLPRPARVLELGCGVGNLWRENVHRIAEDWDVTLSDFSAGMLEKARQNLKDNSREFTFRVIDAVDIPFEDERFDAVIANHMLYYVQDKARGFSEMRRVLKPGGRLYAATNGERHMGELRDLVVAFDPAITFMDLTIESFTLEKGVQQIAEFFGQVELRRYPDGLVVTDDVALRDYVFSSTTISNLPEAKKAALAQFIRAHFASQGGEFRISKDAGMVCARRT